MTKMNVPSAKVTKRRNLRYRRSRRERGARDKSLFNSTARFAANNILIGFNPKSLTQISSSTKSRSSKNRGKTNFSFFLSSLYARRRGDYYYSFQIIRISVNQNTRPGWNKFQTWKKLETLLSGTRIRVRVKTRRYPVSDLDRWTRFRSAANRPGKNRAGCIERRGYRNFIIGARPITNENTPITSNNKPLR